MTVTSRKTSSRNKAVVDLATVYFVEDSSAEIALLKATFKLKNIHLNASYFRTGEELLEHLSCELRDSASQDELSVRGIPDLIVMDLNLPTMSGLELLRAIKSSSAIAHIPVVILSGICDSEDARQAAKEGALHYFTKPLNITVLKEITSLAAQLQFEAQGEAFYLRKGVTSRTRTMDIPEEDFL